MPSLAKFRSDTVDAGLGDQDCQVAHPSVKEVSAPGLKPNEYYIFTQELNADESKLGVPVAVFTLTNTIVHKGDNVTIHFYNTADELPTDTSKDTSNMIFTYDDCRVRH